MTNLNSFFNPKSIAIIGASDHFEKVGGILLKKALESTCNIVPINPDHDYLLDIQCYKNVLDYPGKIDLAVIAIPRDFVEVVLEQCGKKKIKNVIIVSAGFSEQGDVLGEKRIMGIAKKYAIRILGPNCFGIFNSLNNLDLTFSMTRPAGGNIALVSQSGAMWSFLADAFSETGFSKFVGLGNMSDLEFNDFIDYFSHDSEIKSIILYIEKLKNGTKFIEVCKRAILAGKKIYAVKAGSSFRGSKAAFSHTGSLATDYEIYKGAFRQAGIIMCKTMEEAVLKASKQKIIFKTKNLKLHNEVKIITNAGGAGVLLSDYLSERGFNVLESKDIIGTALANNYEKALGDLFNFNGSIFVILTSQSMTQIEETARVCVEMSNKLKKQIIPVFLGGKIMDEANKIFEQGKTVFFNNFVEITNSI